MLAVFKAIPRIAGKRQPVLITGETGTGKELVARAIHDQGPDRDRPYVVVDCGALSVDIVESEIFGHVRGAFTGAIGDRPGLLASAGRGTLFLDEVGELPLALQAKFFRVLQDREFRPVGGDTVRRFEGRVIAATNQDPAEAVKNGKLREDLYYRLNVFALTLPTLRERKEDLSLLIQSFLGEFNARNGKSIVALNHEAMRILESHNWPGNVRELRNVIERATILADGQFIEPRHLPNVLMQVGETAQRPLSLSPGTTVEEAERRLIQMTLEHTKDNKTRAADILGISLKTLHNKLNKLKLRK